MPNLSPQLFDNALSYLDHQQTKVHYKYVVNNIKDSAARLVIEKLLNEGLIKKVENSDYYKITEFGRDVVNGGGYRHYADAKDYHAPSTVRYDTMRKISGINQVLKRKQSEQILLPVPPVEKKNKIRKVLDFLAHPDTKTVIQTIVWIIAILTGAITFFKWVLPYLNHLNK